VTKYNVILCGPVGSGKTSSLRTVPGPLFVIATEPGIESILDHANNIEGGTPWAKARHWAFIPPADPDWSTMIDNANKLNKFTQEQLMKMPGVNRQDYTQFISVLNTCANLKCDICGEKFGAMDHLGPEWTVAVDGLSGLSTMSMDLVAGGKPVKTQADWGSAMDNVERLVMKWTGSTKCNFVLVSHLDREYDELTGGTKLMVSTLGRKLAPRIPRFFDEVVYCHRAGTEFFWSSTEANVDTKVRRLPFSDKIKPDFGQLK